MTDKICKMTARELSKLLCKKEIKSEEVVSAFIKRIEAVENEVNAFISLCPENALKKAKEIDKKRVLNEVLPSFSSIPIGIKDNICTKDILTTCGSKMLENFISPYNAFAIEKAEQENLIILGKTNMDEFGMGSSTENSFYKITKNPVNTEYVAGGSSGGSAAAIKAYEVPFALGSDTGGSVRQPAAYCGVVGMKPTYGAVSRYGLVAFASSFEQIGPITKNIEDNAYLLNIIAGYDEKDSTSQKRKYTPFNSKIYDGVKGTKMALPREFFDGEINHEVKNAILNAAKIYEKMGAEISEISIPSLKYALPAYYIISSAEASSNLARFDGVKYGFRAQSTGDIFTASRSESFGAEVKRRIMLGTFALSSGYYDEYYKKALNVKNIIIQEFEKVFEKYDILLSPVTPDVAHKIGEKSSSPIEMYKGDIYTVGANISGLPALSLPCGETTDGLPIGMQLMGKAFCEADLYRAGYAFERRNEK